MSGKEERMGRQYPKRFGRRGLAALVGALVIALGAGCGGENAATPTPTAAVTATPAPTRTPTPSRTPTATPTPTEDATATAEERTITSIQELVGEFGEPPSTGFARLRIPLLGVDGPVGASTVGESGVMSAPYNPVEVTWYDMRLWPGMGGAPGESGNAIFSGHVDYAAHIAYADGVYYRGKGIFGSLELLSPGDIVEVVYNGQVLKYAVAWQRDLSAIGDDWAPIWSNDVAVDSITLYTCGGDFDFQTRQYSHRVVVRAERMG